MPPKTCTRRRLQARCAGRHGCRPERRVPRSRFGFAACAPENSASKLHDHPLSAHLDALDKAIGEGERLRKVYAEHVAAATPSIRLCSGLRRGVADAFGQPGLRPAREVCRGGRFARG